VGEDFSYMLGELGLGGRRPACRTLLAPSPFDHERQALALTLADLPAPEAPRFGERLAGVLLELRRRVRRQTLVLFTSYRLLDEVAARLEAAAAAARAAGEPDPVGALVVQSARSGAAQTLSRFRGGDASMLLGTSTFWEGVDFPGRALEILVVTKLPFLVPSDPWVEARCERLQHAGENPFTAFMVRDAALRLRQGVGRLLRRDTDRGVILLLDNRLHTKSYGTTFLSALPMVPRAASDVPDLVGRIARFWETSGT